VEQRDARDAPKGSAARSCSTLAVPCLWAAPAVCQAWQARHKDSSGQHSICNHEPGTCTMHNHKMHTCVPNTSPHYKQRWRTQPCRLWPRPTTYAQRSMAATGSDRKQGHNHTPAMTQSSRCWPLASAQPPRRRGSLQRQRQTHGRVKE
jgi:hypothetical protein